MSSLHWILVIFLLVVYAGIDSCNSFEYKSHYLNRIRGRRHGTRHKREALYEEPIIKEKQLEKEEEVNFLSDEGSSQVEIFPGSEIKSRKKRSGIFAWPPSSVFVTQFSLEIPLFSPEGVGVPFLLEVPWEFDLPNITDVFLTADEARNSKERMSFYQTIEALFSRFGFDGKSCVLRAVCERAETNIISHGLLGEVISLILAASATGESANSLSSYIDAEYHGKAIGDCASKFDKCPISIFHFFD